SSAPLYLRRKDNTLLPSGPCLFSYLYVQLHYELFFGNYFMPAFPFLALIFAVLIGKMVPWFWDRVAKFVSYATPIAMFSLLVLPISFGPEMMPAFRYFAPFIQNSGSCSDSVMFIDGGSLYGGQNAYFCQVAFYTGRKLLPSSCEDALRMIEEKKPAWVLFAGDAQVRCLKNMELPSYVTRLKFGSQHLWGVYQSDQAEFDLTPLYRQLLPPVDCKPKELKSTPWIRFEAAGS
ncbi:MAG: hypothetical protein KGP28_02180, partial [Bdellovibrionales bacterium]|nr:hypothetical protein [Bdellovibrionales bacterium]